MIKTNAKSHSIAKNLPGVMGDPGVVPGGGTDPGVVPGIDPGAEPGGLPGWPGVVPSSMLACAQPIRPNHSSKELHWIGVKVIVLIAT